MSPRAEKVLIALLPDTESLVILTREGLPEECVPSEELRDVLVWAKEYYGRTRRAPSVEMVKERYGDLLSDHEIDIDDEPDETMEWVIDSLKANRVKAEVARHAKDLVRGVREAPPEHKVEALAEHVSRLVEHMTERQGDEFKIVDQSGTLVDRKGGEDAVLAGARCQWIAHPGFLDCYALRARCCVLGGGALANRFVQPEMQY